MQTIGQRCERVGVGGDAIDTVFNQAQRNRTALPIEQRCEYERADKDEDELSTT